MNESPISISNQRLARSVRLRIVGSWLLFLAVAFAPSRWAALGFFVAAVALRLSIRTVIPQPSGYFGFVVIALIFGCAAAHIFLPPPYPVLSGVILGASLIAWLLLTDIAVLRSPHEFFTNSRNA